MGFTDSDKYRELRKSLANAGTKSQTTLVSMISAAVAVYVGVAAGALVPFCALCLFALATVGKNAFCEGSDLNVKVTKRTRKEK